MLCGFWGIVFSFQILYCLAVLFMPVLIYCHVGFWYVVLYTNVYIFHAVLWIHIFHIALLYFCIYILYIYIYIYVYIFFIKYSFDCLCMFSLFLVCRAGVVGGTARYTGAVVQLCLYVYHRL